MCAPPPPNHCFNSAVVKMSVVKSIFIPPLNIPYGSSSVKFTNGIGSVVLVCLGNSLHLLIGPIFSVYPKILCNEPGPSLQNISMLMLYLSSRKLVQQTCFHPCPGTTSRNLPQHYFLGYWTFAPRGWNFCQIPFFSPLIPTLSRGRGVGVYIDSCIKSLRNEDALGAFFTAGPGCSKPD